MGVILLAFLPCAMPQQGGQTGGGTGSGGSEGGTAGTAPKQPTMTSQPQFGAPQAPQEQILFVSGVVVLEDGTPPPFGAVIERDCGRGARKESTVDSSGRFSFQVGGPGNFSGMLPDASESSIYGYGRDTFGNNTSQQVGSSSSVGLFSSANLAGCELRARLQGYRSSRVRLDANSMSRQIEVGTIVLHPIEKVQGTVVSVTNLQAPKAAKKALERAQKALRKNDIQKAEKNLRAAVGAYPQYAEAWFDLGQVCEQQQRSQEARNAYLRAVEADRTYVYPYVRLARLAGLENNWREVASLTDRALALDPLDFPEAYFLNALAYYNLGNLDAAEESARKEQRLDGQHRIPQVHLILANILARKHDIEGSIEETRSYLKFAPRAPDAEQVRLWLQENEKLLNAASDKRLEPQ